MRPPTISGLVHVGLDILTTTVNAVTKRILAQFGDVVKESTETDGAEWWQHVGLASRPSKPQPGKQAAQAVVLKTSDRDVAIASVDQRGLSLYGNLDHGETCLYAAGEDGNAQARVLLKKDGTVAIYTLQGNAAGGASITIQVRPNGEIHMASPLGGLSIVNGKLTLLSASGSGIEMSASGVRILGATNTINGSVVLGDATATGVATQQSQLLMTASLIAACAALQAFFNFPAIAALSGGTAQPAAAAVAALGVTAALPTNYSLKVKAS
jgi:hypothetical protein